MLTFKQSVILLVSIITILAIIAVVTGLSPLYWPRPGTSSTEGNSSSSLLNIKMASPSTVKTQRTTRLNAVTKKALQTTTVTIATALPVTTNITVT